MSRMTSALHQAKAALRKELKAHLAAMTEEERLRQSNIIAQKRYGFPRPEEKELRARLAAMSEEERLRQSNIIALKLFAMPKFESSRRVCLYLHMKEEVQTVSILKHLLAANKECFIPQYIGPTMKMVKLKSWEDYESLPETKWKIKQPSDDDVRPDALDTGGLDMMLMPGLGFTCHGDRIGRGKGYYDTYLQKCRESGHMPITVALAYTQQICDSIPVTDNDMTVDVVLSPD